MKIDLITIFRKYILEHSYYISPIIGYWKYSQIFLNLEGYSMSLEPVITLLRGEFPDRFSDEFPASSILACKDLLVIDTRRHIASPSSRDDDFLSW
jgi:hypothetical protein